MAELNAAPFDLVAEQGNEMILLKWVMQVHNINKEKYGNIYVHDNSNEFVNQTFLK